MKAILVKEGKLVISEVADPVPGEGDVLVDIYAAALNRADLLQKKGTYPSPAGWPQWPGLELSGKVIALGKTAAEKSPFKIGDSVCALVGGGAYAEKIAVPYQLVLPVPRGLSMEEAASLPEAYTTSSLNLFKEGHLQKGQTVYVAAGASGLASAAIPMAKGFGAKVITDVLISGNKEKIASLGADYIADLSVEKISDVFRRLNEEGTPVNCAMDCLGGADMGNAL
ncbi:MAG: alcohol dehydrogenase catalytic domain-containing protein, partial [Candidatus Avelusimicrobium sp.]